MNITGVDIIGITDLGSEGFLILVGGLIGFISSIGTWLIQKNIQRNEKVRDEIYAPLKFELEKNWMKLIEGDPNFERSVWENVIRNKIHLISYIPIKANLHIIYTRELPNLSKYFIQARKIARKEVIQSLNEDVKDIVSFQEEFETIINDIAAYQTAIGQIYVDSSLFAELKSKYSIFDKSYTDFRKRIIQKIQAEPFFKRLETVRKGTLKILENTVIMLDRKMKNKGTMKVSRDDNVFLDMFRKHNRFFNEGVKK